MVDNFEGDLIRPLGILTLYFAYAEYEVDLFLEFLSPIEPFDKKRRQWSVGRKLTLVQRLVRQLHGDGSLGREELFANARSLIERRNKLIHSCVLAGGRVISGRPGVPEWRVSPEEISELAEQIFTWKENVHAYHCLVIAPLLLKHSTNATLEKSSPSRD
jgi:hypothetical protein